MYLFGPENPATCVFSFIVFYLIQTHKLMKKVLTMDSHYKRVNTSFLFGSITVDINLIDLSLFSYVL